MILFRLNVKCIKKNGLKYSSSKSEYINIPMVKVTSQMSD